MHSSKLIINSLVIMIKYVFILPLISYFVTLFRKFGTTILLPSINDLFSVLTPFAKASGNSNFIISNLVFERHDIYINGTIAISLTEFDAICAKAQRVII